MNAKLDASVAPNTVEKLPGINAGGISTYFPNLDSLRFFAAVAVVVHHVEQIRQLSGAQSSFGSNFTIMALGSEGVRVFFVLSGFLISFLLLREQSVGGGVNLRAFYLRRILRIWPLYFVITIVGFVAVPSLLAFHRDSAPELYRLSLSVHEHFWEKLGLFLFFLPNLCLQIFPPVPGAAQCWSLGVEEQYYLGSPLLMNCFRRFQLLGLLALVLAKYLLLWGLHSSLSFQYFDVKFVERGCIFLQGLDFESFAAGGISAFLLFNHRHRLQKVFSNPIWGRLVVAAVVAVLFCETLPRGIIGTIVFAALVLKLSLEPPWKGGLHDKIRYLGRISYGIYMFHPLAIFLAVKIIREVFPGGRDAVGAIVLYVLSFSGTVLISSLSYSRFESYFLRLKHKFEVVSSSSIS